nr:PREDICTED: interleukin-17 receptor D-like [Lepisosteus oculatus]
MGLAFLILPLLCSELRLGLAKVLHRKRAGSPTVNITEWVPENITVSGTGSTMNVTFSKAPDSYGISSYTVLYTRCQEVNWQRVTVQHPLQLQGALQVLLHDLSPRTDYCIQVSCSRCDAAHSRPLVVERKGLFGSLGSPSSPAPQSCLQSSPPSIFLCYSPWGGPQHTRLALALASYLQLHCACQVGTQQAARSPRLPQV